MYENACTCLCLLIAVLWKRIDWWWKRILVYENARQNVFKNAWKSPSSIKSIVTALLQFGSRCITMTHFLQKLISCNKLCAIIIAGRHDKLFFSRSYLDFRACCDMLFMETYAICWIFFTRKCLDSLQKTVLITLDGRSHAVSVAFLLQVVRPSHSQQCQRSMIITDQVN